MLKTILSIALIGMGMYGSAQTEIKDSVEMGASYQNEVYYKLTDGSKTSVDATSWHLGFATNAMSVAIMTNAGIPGGGMGQAGMEVAVYPNGTVDDFSTVDTAGFSTWPKLYNDSLDWEIGALNQNSIGGMDYGWGEYNLATHTVTGDSIYIFKIGMDAFKVEIQEKASGVWSFRYAPISDNGAGTQVSIDGPTNYSTKNFVFFNLVDGQIKDVEQADWDLWAVKYHDMYNNQYPNQTVTGILVNPKWEVAAVNAGVGNQSTHADFASATFVTDKNELGQFYKGLNSSFQWEVTDSTVYYLKNANGDVWKWYPTSFGGSSNGKTVFFKEQMVVGTNGVNEVESQFLDIYPNPATNNINLVFNSLSSDATVLVRNQMGQKIVSKIIQTQAGINQEKLDISSLKSGVYFIVIKQNGHTTTSKVVKY